MESTTGRRFLIGFVVPAAVAALLGVVLLSVESSAMLQLGAAAGLLCWSALLVHDARRTGTPVPLAAVAVLLCVVPVVIFVVGFVVGATSSEAAGTWIARASLAGLMSAGLAVLMGLLLPSHRRLAKVACVLVVVLPRGTRAPVVAEARNRGPYSRCSYLRGSLRCGRSTARPHAVRSFSVAFYDGLLRERATQAPSPGVEGGRVMTEKCYDDRGWVAYDHGPYYKLRGRQHHLEHGRRS